MRNGLIVDEDGTKRWYQNNLLHQTDGPAVELVNGIKEWYQHGQRHRTNGPAVEYADGDKEWYQHGLLHRIDGPAVEHYTDNIQRWCVEGVAYDFNDWLELVDTYTEVEKTLMRLKHA